PVLKAVACCQIPFVPADKYQEGRKAPSFRPRMTCLEECNATPLKVRWRHIRHSNPSQFAQLPQPVGPADRTERGQSLLRDWRTRETRNRQYRVRLPENSQLQPPSL